MFVALIVPVAGPVRREPVAGLDDLNRLVGGWIEGYPTPRPDVMAYGNEEGRLQGLATNVRASRFLGFEVVGDLVFFGVNGTEEIDAPEGLEENFA